MAFNNVFPPFFFVTFTEENHDHDMPLNTGRDSGDYDSGLLWILTLGYLLSKSEKKDEETKQQPKY